MSQDINITISDTIDINITMQVIDGSAASNSILLDGQAASYYLNRLNHTGVQPTSSVTGLDAALAASTSHIANTSNPHNTTKAQVGLGNADDTSDEDKPISIAQQAALDAISAEVDTKQDIIPYTTENAANKNQINGYAGLDGSGLIPAGLLPGFVDDVLEFANLGAFPVSGTSGILYVALDTAKVYRWGGSSYVEISGSPGSTDAVPEGSLNLYFTAARVLATPLTGLSLLVGTAVSASDSLVTAIGKLQKQISDNLTTLSSHISNTSNPHAVTPTQLGLGNVDNTADINKNVNSALTLTNSRTIDGQGFNGSTNITVIAPGTVAATSKATPVDADVMPIADSAASNVLKKLTWANLKAALKTYLDTLYSPLPAALHPWYLPPLIAGNRYVSSAIQFQFADGGAVTAGRAYYSPYYSRQAWTYHAIGILVNSGVIGAKIRLAIYADNGSNAPGALVYDSGDLTVPGTGEQAIDKVADFSLDAFKQYWFKFVSDNAAITVQVSASNTPDYAWMGRPGTMGSAAANIRAYGMRVSNPGYAAPANPAEATSPSQSTTPVVQILA
jgi:hypothetical protein